MRVCLIGSLHRVRAGASFIALLACTPDVSAQSSGETPVSLDRVEAAGSITEPAMNSQSTTSSQSGRLSYSDRSLINDRRYDIVLIEDGLATITDVADGNVIEIPVDVIKYASIAYNTSFQQQASSVTSVKYDASTGSFDFLIQNTVPLVSAAILILLVLSGALFWIIYRARREKSAMRKSRRRLVLARDGERKKLATDLHDGPIQELQLLLRTASDTPSMTHSGIKTTSDKLQAVSDQLRDICAELRPPVLHHFGFPRAARGCMSKFREHFPSIDLHENIQEFEDRMSEEERTTIYRALQESLMNVGRHAEAENVWVDVIRTGNEVVYSIRDDGRGFVLPKRLSDLEAEGHLGLSFLSQRIEATGARLHIKSRLGDGTEIRVTIAMKAENLVEMDTTAVTGAV